MSYQPVFSSSSLYCPTAGKQPSVHSDSRDCVPLLRLFPIPKEDIKLTFIILGILVDLSLILSVYLLHICMYID